LRLVGDGHRSRPCWGAGGDQRLSKLSIGTKRSLFHAKVGYRLTTDGVVHETLTIKDIDLQILRETRGIEGHGSWPCWGAGGDQRLSKLSIGTKRSLFHAKVG